MCAFVDFWDWVISCLTTGENMSYYEIYRDNESGWRWRLKAANHQIISSGESYVSEWSVLRGIAGHRKAATTKTIKNLQDAHDRYDGVD